MSRRRQPALSHQAPFTLLLVVSTWVACERGVERPDLIYRVDAAMRGWVVILFDRPAAPPLPKVGEAYLLDVPRSGVLATSTRQMVGRGRDLFRGRDADGHEKPMSPGLVRAHRTGVRNQGDGTSIEYELFFVGTEAELGAAESDDAALSRALLDLD